MIVYIADKKTFINKAVVTAVDYEVKESIYDVVSTITIPTPKVAPQEGDFLMFDGLHFVGIINAVQIDRGKTIVSVEQAVKMFSRDMFYTAGTYTYLEDYLKSLIDANYVYQSDEIYETPFLTVNALSHTAGTVTPDIESNVYNIKSYISKLRRIKDIVCEWSFGFRSLNLNIYKKTFPTHNIDLSNPRYVVTEQTFSDYSVGKITVYCEENTSYTTWYLLTDGTITQTYTGENRIDGDWITLTVQNTADIQNAVQDEFAKNYYSHKISFYSDKEYGLYDRLKIRMNGRIYNSYVSGLVRQKNSKYILIECGELQTVYPYLERL